MVCPSFLWLRRRANNMAISPLLPIRFPWFQVQDRSEQVFFLVSAYAGCLTGQLRGRNSRPKLVRCRRELDRPVTPCFMRESWVTTQFARIPRLKGIQNILKLITIVGSCYMTTYFFYIYVGIQYKNSERIKKWRTTDRRVVMTTHPDFLRGSC